MALGTALVVLVHEWVTGGGLAGSPLPGSWEREGSAMRRVIARDFAALSTSDVEVVMTLDARLPAEPGPWRVESIAPGEHGRKLRELCRRADFTVLVAPETRGMLAELDPRSSSRQAHGCSGLPLRLSTLPATRLGWLYILSELGIDTPPSRTIVPGEGLPESARYPAVLKPVDGAGSVDTFYLEWSR